MNTKVTVSVDNQMDAGNRFNGFRYKS